MKLQLVFLLAIAPLLAACSTTQSTTTNVVPAPSSNVASATISRDFYVAVDSIVVHFEDDSAHTVVLHRHDVIHVEGHATASTYRAHIGEHFARVPTSALSEYVERIPPHLPQAQVTHYRQGLVVASTISILVARKHT